MNISLQVPDGSDVRILLDDPINTNLNNAWDSQKTSLTIAIMAFIGPIVDIIIIFLLIVLVIRWNKRGK